MSIKDEVRDYLTNRLSGFAETHRLFARRARKRLGCGHLPELAEIMSVKVSQMTASINPDWVFPSNPDASPEQLKMVCDHLLSFLQKEVTAAAIRSNKFDHKPGGAGLYEAANEFRDFARELRKLLGEEPKAMGDLSPDEILAPYIAKSSVPSRAHFEPAIGDIQEFINPIANPPKIKNAVPARLDADRTAKPLTKIVHHPGEGQCVGIGIPLRDPAYVDEAGNKTPLTDPHPTVFRRVPGFDDDHPTSIEMDKLASKAERKLHGQ